MSRQRQDQLLSSLLRQGEWVTAASLADQLGVTPRSIRSYVAALNARTGGADAVESGPAGYRGRAATPPRVTDCTVSYAPCSMCRTGSTSSPRPVRSM